MDLESTISLAFFAYGLMVVIAALAAFLIRGIVVALARAGKKPQPVATPVSISVAPARDDTAEHVAAVAAAVYAVLGAHRLVRIAEVSRSPAWWSAGRAAHHGSHTPRRDGR